jgi:hypothetical protein
LARITRRLRVPTSHEISATTEVVRRYVGITPDELLFQNRLIEEGRTPTHTPMLTDPVVQSDTAPLRSLGQCNSLLSTKPYRDGGALGRNHREFGRFRWWGWVESHHAVLPGAVTAAA